MNGNEQERDTAEGNRETERAERKESKHKACYTEKKQERVLKEGEKSGEKVTCRNRKERKQPPFSPMHVGSMLHKDFFVVVLLDKGLLP